MGDYTFLRGPYLLGYSFKENIQPVLKQAADARQAAAEGYAKRSRSDWATRFEEDPAGAMREWSIYSQSLPQEVRRAHGGSSRMLTSVLQQRQTGTGSLPTRSDLAGNISSAVSLDRHGESVQAEADASVAEGRPGNAAVVAARRLADRHGGNWTEMVPADSQQAVARNMVWENRKQRKQDAEDAKAAQTVADREAKATQRKQTLSNMGATALVGGGAGAGAGLGISLASGDPNASAKERIKRHIMYTLGGGAIGAGLGAGGRYIADKLRG